MRASSGVAVLAGDRVRLGAGRHSSPAEGACVVEFASLLAREGFSDRPQCVCPVIAAFLRGWNDRAAYADRQRLRPYALRIVGTRADRRVTRMRRDTCLAWIGTDLGGGPIERLVRRLALRARIAVFCGLAYAWRLDEGAAEYAARVLYGKRDVDWAFALLDAMLEVGENSSARIVRQVVSANGAAHSNGIPAVRGNGSPANGARSADLEHV